MPENSPTREVAEGIRRVTFPLPLGIDHVHCYFLRGEDGWTLVDTGLGVDDPEAYWAPALGTLDGPVVRIVVTHFHPDHVGGSADIAKLTGAPVYQGRADYAQCVGAWEGGRGRLIDFMRSHGLPADEAAKIQADSERLRSHVRYAHDPNLLDPGDEVDGWSVLHLPGHADGHIALLRDGVLIAGDTILGGITPAVGLYPLSRPDPLGDYLGSLRRIEELAPSVAFGGHGSVISAPVERAREIIEHHAERLALAEAALGAEPRTAYDVSLGLFPSELPPAQRRFALAESLAHLERLVLEDRAERVEGDGITRYLASSATQSRVSINQNASPA
jgi:glyoxylase-like metal-dependent hydrolase (beta-lactamase superfamily II)